MVVINNIKCPVTQLYSPTGFIGDIENEDQLNDVRIQIAEQNLEGYYIIWDSEKETIKINISKDGEIDKFPPRLWDNAQRSLARLFEIRRSKK